MTSTLNYSNVNSRNDVNTWLTQSTQLVKIDNPYIHTDVDQIKWIEQYSIKIGFHILVIFMSENDNMYACHTVENDFNQYPFPMLVNLKIMMR